MSGGSWDYAHRQFEDVATRLQSEKCPKRRALGNLIDAIANAMHAIEWVDSGDCSPPHDDEAIAAVFASCGGGMSVQMLKVLTEEARALVIELNQAADGAE